MGPLQGVTENPAGSGLASAARAQGRVTEFEEISRTLENLVGDRQTTGS